MTKLRRIPRLSRALSSLASERQQLAQAGISQIKPSPNEHAEYGRGDEFGERIADTHMRRDGAAKIACQQDGAQYASARNYIDDGAGNLDYAKTDCKVFVPSKMLESLHDLPQGVWSRLIELIVSHARATEPVAAI